MSGRNRRTVAPMGLLMAAALTMLAAPVYAFLGEKGIDVSPAVGTSRLPSAGSSPVSSGFSRSFRR